MLRSCAPIPSECYNIAKSYHCQLPTCCGKVLGSGMVVEDEVLAEDVIYDDEARAPDSATVCIRLFTMFVGRMMTLIS